MHNNIFVHLFNKGKDLMKWRRLLLFESKYGPLPGQKSKLVKLTETLDEVYSKNAFRYIHTLSLVYISLTNKIILIIDFRSRQRSLQTNKIANLWFAKWRWKYEGPKRK